MKTNAYLYIPKKDAVKEIEKLMVGRPYQMIGTLILYPVKRISTKEISFMLSIGKNQEIGFNPHLRKNDQRKKLVENLVALVTDGSEMERVNNRESYEQSMLEFLGMKKEKLEYFGTFCGDTDSLRQE